MADRVRRGERKEANAVAAVRFLYRFMTPARRGQLGFVLVFMVAGAAAEMVTIGAALPFLSVIAGHEAAGALPLADWMVERLGGTETRVPIWPAAFLLVVAAGTATALRLTLTWFTQKFVFGLGHDIGVGIYARTIRQPYSAYVRRNSSEVIAGVEKVQLAISGLLLPLMQAGVATFMAAVVIATLIAISPGNAIIAATAMAAVYAAISYAMRRILRRNSVLLNDLYTGRVKLLQEAMGGMRDILIDQSQPVFEEGFRRLDDALRRAQMVNSFIAQAPRYVVEGAGIILLALLSVFMSRQPGGLVAALPVLGALALGAQRLLPMLHLVYFGWSRVAGSLHLLLEMVRLLQIPILQDPASRPPHLNLLRQAVEFRDVSFTYPDAGRPALAGISFELGRGRRLGLIGRTGSGKSTLLDLLMGLLEPSSGEIRIDGALLDEDRRCDWQRQIAHVSQTIYLADASIAANIAFGCPAAQIDMARLREAAERAQIDDFVRQLSQGYATAVGERGIRLSGGQRQRIGIARALYKSAQLLILDEATSALDDETEARVLDALGGDDRARTIVMVAHRLSTLARCDAVIRLDEGQLVEMGSFQRVAAETTPPRSHANPR